MSSIELKETPSSNRETTSRRESHLSRLLKPLAACQVRHDRDSKASPCKVMVPPLCTDMCSGRAITERAGLWLMKRKGAWEFICRNDAAHLNRPSSKWPFI